MIPGTLYLDVGIDLITFALYGRMVCLAYDYDMLEFYLWKSDGSLAFKVPIA